MNETSQMPTTITIDQHQSPTSSRSASRSESISEEEFSSDETWDYIPDDHEIEPSDSASRPRTSRRPTPVARPTRRHTTTERSTRRPPVSRVRHVHVAPPSSLEPDDYPGYGRGYPGPYGGRTPQPPAGYAPSAYSVAPGGGGYAPPFGGPGGALTHYGPQGGYQYPNANPFSPHPAPPVPGGAGYFNGGHHPMSTHGAPAPYGGHEMMPYPPMPGYGGFPGGYPGMPPHMPYYPQQWPPSDPSVTGDPEVEKKLLAIEELMKNQKIDFEKAQKELAARDAADAAAKKAAEAKEAAAKLAAEEKAAWEKKLDEEKKAASKLGAENAKKQIEAEKKKAEQAAADEKEKADAKAAVAKAEADAKAAVEKAEKERKEAVEKAEKEAKEAITKAEKEAKESIDKALAPKDDKRKPVKFKDAVGRKFSFPFHLCATWSGMEDLIKQAFMHVDQFSQHVADGHYDLIGPNGEIILPQVWETMIEPDWNVTMMMWPVPEKPPMPGPPPGLHGMRPGSRHHGRPPPGPPPPHHRGGPPPPPGNWPGGPARPGAHAGPGPGPGPGGAPAVIVLPPGQGPPRPSRRRTEPASAKGVLGWMAGKPAKSSGKGPKKAEQYNTCLIM